MTWQRSRTLAACVVLATLGIAAAIAGGRPEPVVLAAPFVVASLVGLAPVNPVPTIRVACALDRQEVLEGDVVDLHVEVRADGALRSLELAVALPTGTTADLSDRVFATALDPGEPCRFTVPLRCEHWGVVRVGTVALRAHDRWGLLVSEGAVEATLELEITPAAHTLRRLIRPRAARAAAGNQLARVRAPGVEVADLRPFQPGDRARDVNWRATARRQVLTVNDHHPDRSTDVVVLLDSFTNAGLSRAVNAAASIVRAYLANRDRVGLVTFGGLVQWVRPGSGLRQEYVVCRALLGTITFDNAADKPIAQVPPTLLPRNALVLGLSPLHDDRFATALVDLRRRGVDVVCIEIAPSSESAPGRGPIAQAAHRWWLLRRAATRDELRALGIPVVEWNEDDPLSVVVEEVAAWPRVARPGR